jgi:predicted ester cyclase
MNPHRRLLEVWFDRVWAKLDTAAIHEMLAPNMKTEGLGAAALLGPDQFLAFHQTMCRLLSDVRITIQRSIESEDWIAAVCTVTAKAKSNGKAISFPGAVHGRIKDGRIVEGSNHFDFLSLFAQLGLLPGDTFERCLAGNQVA